MAHLLARPVCLNECASTLASKDRAELVSAPARCVLRRECGKIGTRAQPLPVAETGARCRTRRHGGRQPCLNRSAGHVVDMISLHEFVSVSYSFDNWYRDGRE